MEPNNSGGSNAVVTTVLIVTVAGVVGYLLYKAGKGTAAAAANGTSGVYGGTALPTHAPAGVKPVQQAGQSNVSAVTGLLNNVLGLFKKGATKSAVRTVNGVSTQSGSSSGGAATAGGIFGGFGSGSTGSGGEQGQTSNNNWDGNGGYIVIYSDGGADYFYSDNSYAGFSDDIGTWESPGGGGAAASGDKRYDNNWDGQGGYMMVYPDGSAEYFYSDGVYGEAWDPIGTWQ